MERAVFRLTLSVERVFDLRGAAVWRQLSREDAPTGFLDRSIARATVTVIRATTDAQAIIVPSVCFLDQLDRWCLVLVLEKLPDLGDFVTGTERMGPLRRG